MDFFMNTTGTITASLPSAINQGANNAYNINLYTTFSSDVVITAAFKLANGEIKSPYALSYQGIVPDTTIDNSALYWWTLTLPGAITRYYGQTALQFFVSTAQMTLASTTATFNVLRGIPQVIDDTSPIDTIIENIAQLQSDVDNGYFAARAIKPWTAEYAYGVDEIIWYPGTENNELGQFLMSLTDDNSTYPYTDGVLSDNWQVIVNFDNILGQYTAALEQATQEGIQELADSVEHEKVQLRIIAAEAERQINNSVTDAEDTLDQYKYDTESAATSAANSAANAANSAEYAAQQAQDLASLANKIVQPVPELPEISAANPEVIYAVVSQNTGNIFTLYTVQNDEWLNLGEASFVATGNVTRLIALTPTGWQLNDNVYTQSVQFVEANPDSTVSSSPLGASVSAWINNGVTATNVTDQNIIYTAQSLPGEMLNAVVSVDILSVIPSTDGYYTKSQTDEAIANEAAARAAADNNINTQINNIIGGQTPVGLAQKATADGNGNNIEQTYAKQSGTYAQLNVGHSTNADNATKATQDASGNVITNTYATKTELAGKANTSGTYPDLNVGHSTNSDSATKAAQDGAGNVITNTYATKEENALKADSATVNAAIALKQDITDNTLETTDKTVVGAINENKQAIDGIREDMINADHFKGFAADAAAVQSTPGDANDYIYCIGTGTIWNYGSSGWTDSGKPYPSDATPLATTVPLADGTGAAGTSTNAARSDHVHPTDTSRASAADLTAEINARQTADTNLNSAITNEASTRAAADTALSNRITGIENGTTPIPLAQKATADAAGNNIEQTYAKKDELGNMFNSSGTYPELTAGKATADASGNVITDTYAAKTELAGKANTSGTYTDLNVGHATNADNATKATQDANGNVISTTYATNAAMTAALAGKADTTGTYSGMTVGNATNAASASKVANTLSITTHENTIIYDGSAPATVSIIRTQTVTLTGWNDNTCTIYVDAVTPYNTVLVSPTNASAQDVYNNQIECTAQGSGTLTFSCATQPAANVTVDLIIIG